MPYDKWFAVNFPTGDECVDKWCGKQMRAEILDSIDTDIRDVVAQHGWVPFISIDRTYINPDAKVVSFHSDCDIDDFNLEEHGISIMRVQRRRKAGGQALVR